MVSFSIIFSLIFKPSNVKGFRKGRAPLKIIRRQYGQAVHQEVVGDVINSSYIDALEQEGIHPAGNPNIDVNTMEVGKDLEYVATIEVYPEVVLGEFGEYEITKLNAKVEDADIDRAIERLREEKAVYVNVERNAADGDQVTIDFLGTKDGEEFEGGKGENFKLALGSNSMIHGFEEGIVGMAIGDEKTLSLIFPDDYQADDLKGKNVEFSITLHKVEEKQLPVVDAEFMNQLSSSDSMEGFRSEIQTNMEYELKHALEKKLKSTVMDKLIENHSFELPKALIDKDIEFLRAQMMQQFNSMQAMQQNQSLDLKALLPDDMFKEQAERRTAITLILDKIIKENDIKVDADRVRAYIEESAASYERPEEVINYYYQSENMLAKVESFVLESMVVDIILEQAIVNDSTVSYDEAVAAAGELGK